jgi:hypothetical protein
MNSLVQLAAEHKLIAYHDPGCRNRYILVYADEWSLGDLKLDVARPGGMRISPLFIGTAAACEGWIHGCEWGESDRFGRMIGNRKRAKAPDAINVATNTGKQAGAGLGSLHLKIGAKHLTIETSMFFKYHDGFSFGVTSELDAFHAAYLYRYSKSVKVEDSPTGWRVSVYRNLDTTA